MSNSVLPDLNTINFHIIHFNQEFPEVHLLEIYLPGISLNFIMITLFLNNN